MRIALFEDDAKKRDDIVDELVRNGVPHSNVVLMTNLAAFASMRDKPIDLYIVDLVMPTVDGGPPQKVGIEILHMLSEAGRRDAPVLAITSYPEIARDLHGKFAEGGCLIVPYDEPNSWKSALSLYMAQAREKGRYDFILVTALEEERRPLAAIKGVDVRSEVRGGLDIWEFTLAGKHGAAVLLPRMGLVTSAVTVAQILESYSPTVIAMSGICAGIHKDAYRGRVLVADPCWEYQSGKWLSDAFLAEPYQASLPGDTLVHVHKFLEDDNLVAKLEADFHGERPSTPHKPVVGPFATGSAVIASSERLEHVQEQHRKVLGIDMEAYGFYRAVELSGKRLSAFCAKAVVDNAQEGKGDELHAYGSHVALRFSLKLIEHLLDAR